MSHTAYFIDSTAQPIHEHEGAPYEGDAQSLIDNHGYSLGVLEGGRLYLSKQIVVVAQDIISDGKALPKSSYTPPSPPIEP